MGRGSLLVRSVPRLDAAIAAHARADAVEIGYVDVAVFLAFQHNELDQIVADATSQLCSMCYGSNQSVSAEAGPAGTESVQGLRMALYSEWTFKPPGLPPPELCPDGMTFGGRPWQACSRSDLKLTLPMHALEQAVQSNRGYMTPWHGAFVLLRRGSR